MADNEDAMTPEIDTERSKARVRRRPPSPAGALAAPVYRELPPPAPEDIERAQRAVYHARIYSGRRAVVNWILLTDSDWRNYEQMILGPSGKLVVEIWVELPELSVRLFPSDELPALELLAAQFRKHRPRSRVADKANEAMALAEADFNPPPDAPIAPVGVDPPPDPSTRWVVVTFAPPAKAHAVEIATGEDWFYLEHDCEQSFGMMEIWCEGREVAFRLFPSDTREQAQMLADQFNRMNPTRRSVNDPPELFPDFPPDLLAVPEAPHVDGPVHDPDQTELFAPEFHPGYTWSEAKADHRRVQARAKQRRRGEHQFCEDVT